MKLSSAMLGMVATRSTPGILPSVVAIILWPRLNTPAALSGLSRGRGLGFTGLLSGGTGPKGCVRKRGSQSDTAVTRLRWVQKTALRKVSVVERPLKRHGSDTAVTRQLGPLRPQK